MSQRCFDRSSLIINVVFAVCCSWSHCSGLCCTNTSDERLLTSAPDGKAATPPLSRSSSVPLCVYRLLARFSPLCLQLWIISERVLHTHSSAHTLAHTHTRARAGLTSVSPGWLEYSRWHVSLIHYWSDPAAVICRSLRETLGPSSLAANFRSLHFPTCLKKKNLYCLFFKEKKDVLLCASFLRTLNVTVEDSNAFFFFPCKKFPASIAVKSARPRATTLPKSLCILLRIHVAKSPETLLGKGKLNSGTHLHVAVQVDQSEQCSCCIKI